MNNNRATGESNKEKQTPVQTKSDLIHILREAGVIPSRRYGQNFLIDHNILDIIADTCQINEGDTILEVGTGTGLLTEHLGRRGGRVVTVEIDSRLCALARAYLAKYPNVTIVEGDIMCGGGINPEVLAALEGKCGRGIRVCGNLPYSIATHFLTSLLSQTRLSRGVFVIQDDVARRITAMPRTREYGAISVIMREFFMVSLGRKIHPNCFYPVPNVYSRLIVVEPTGSATAIETFSRFVHNLFSQKRKNILNFMKRLPTCADRDAGVQLLAALGVKPTSRAEELTHQEILSIYNAILPRIIDG